MTWILDQTDLANDTADALGSVFAVGNGAFTTRGADSEAGDAAFRGTWLAGCYTHAGWGLVYPMLAPDWTPVTLTGPAGAPLQATTTGRHLDLARGVSVRSSRWPVAGASVTMIEERGASFADNRLAWQQLVVSVPQGGQVQLVLGVDGTVANHVAKYYVDADLPNVDGPRVRLAAVERAEIVDGIHRVVRHARQTGTRSLALARVVTAAPMGERSTTTGTATTLTLGPGEHLVWKLAFIAGDLPGARPAAAGLGDGAGLLANLDPATVVADHQRALDAFWAGADVTLEGDQRAQASLRFSLWSTRIAAPDDDGAASIGAKNLTGDWYRLAVFWDMEIFQLPMLAAVDPARARNHLRYRARRLDAARSLAAQDGFAGARYPWQSYGTGLEEPPVLGGFLYQQQHVNLAVAWAIGHYHALTGDDRTVIDHGLAVLLEIARFWASRVSEGADGKLHLRGVTGPDEDHQGVDDNTYTNLVLAVTWRRLPSLVERLRTVDPSAVDGLLADLGLADDDLADWAAMADRLHVERAGAAWAQYAGYTDSAEPDETLVGVQGQRPDKPTKQTDTLLMWQLFPREEGLGSLAANWREHAPLCTHASSLSYCSHALLAARLGRERDARRFLDLALGIDLEDAAGNTGHGIHGAGQGGIWLAAVHGYGGLTVDADTVAIDPLLPPAWRRLAFTCQIAGQRLTVSATATEATIEHHGRHSPVSLAFCGDTVSLAAGTTLTRPIRRAWSGQGLEAVLFDLDGVLVTTDQFHYRAWKELADSLGIPFDEERNHALRGVSREESLRRIYADRPLPPIDEFNAQAARKNARYRELLQQMGREQILPGARELLAELRAAGIACAVASASRNTPLVLERTGLAPLLDAVADGNIVTASKPDPQVFSLAAARARALPWNCLGVEDAAAGVEAIHAAGITAIGIGDEAQAAEVVVAATSDLNLDLLRSAWRNHEPTVNPFRSRSVARMKEDQATSYAHTLASGKK